MRTAAVLPTGGSLPPASPAPAAGRRRPPSTRGVFDSVILCRLALAAGLAAGALPSPAAESAPAPQPAAAAGQAAPLPAEGESAVLKNRMLAAESELLRVMTATEAELQRLRAENTRLKEDLSQAKLETGNLKAQLRLLERNQAGGPATRTAAGENVEELQRRITILRRTIEVLTEESRRRAGGPAAATPARPAIP